MRGSTVIKIFNSVRDDSMNSYHKAYLISLDFVSFWNCWFKNDKIRQVKPLCSLPICIWIPNISLMISWQLMVLGTLNGARPLAAIMLTAKVLLLFFFPNFQRLPWFLTTSWSADGDIQNGLVDLGNCLSSLLKLEFTMIASLSPPVANTNQVLLFLGIRVNMFKIYKQWHHQTQHTC